MSFLDTIAQNASQISTGLRIGSSIGGAVGSLLAPSLAGGLADEIQKTNSAYAAVNARRIARQMRYAQGQAAVQNAAGGNGQFGSYIFAIADNARAAEENRQQALLGAQLRNIDVQQQVPTIGEGLLGFSTQILGAVADYKNDKFEGDN